MEDKKVKENDVKDPAHSDEEQDKALIADMLKKYLGDDDNHEEAHKMAMEAFKAYKEMGHESAKALEKCEAYVEMSKHMAAKEAKKEAEPAAANETPDAPKDEKHEEKKEAAPEEVKKLESEIVRLKGEIARFMESEAKTKMESHIENTFKKSGLPMAVTKQFREGIKSVKSTEEFDRLWNVFMEGYKSAPSSGSDKFELPLIEKKVMTESGGFNMSSFLK